MFQIERMSHCFEHNFQVGHENVAVDVEDSYKFIHINENTCDANKSTEHVLNFIEELTRSIITLNLKQSDTDLIFKLCGDLVENVNKLNLKLIEADNGMTAAQILDLTTDLIGHKIFRFSSAFKRKQDMKSDMLHVAPKEVAIGTRFELKKLKRDGKVLKIPRLLQSQLQYIPILETIKALFKRSEFRELYFAHNTGNDHVCQPGRYEYFCCGSIYRNSQLFQCHPNSMQLQIASDDFEICNPLSSKANRHKITAVYFTIRNLPKRFLSKVRNIYLICLCNADDLKTKHTDFNNIWQIIVHEINYLETTGIDIGENTNLKGTITQLAFDNLGANTSLGFVGSFRSSHYCRHCESSNAECEAMCKENIDTLRTVKKYNEQIKIVDASEKVKYDQTKGVKYYCKLSNLKYFHIIDNPTVDIMHDICEGTIPFLLKLLFNSCFTAKVFTPDDLNMMVKFFDYGFLQRKNIPSEISLDKRSLGQNASQSLCLFRNIPFILYRFRENPELKKIWRFMEPFFGVVETTHSCRITEDDLKTMNDKIFILLEELKKRNIKFIPKLHFMLHYARIIRATGPLIHMNMIRYESKHKVFKDFANKTHNFKNINMTLAVKHQELLCKNGYSYVDDVENGMEVPLDKSLTLQHESLLMETFGNEVAHVNQIKWLRVNNYEFRKNLLIIYDTVMYQIQNILISASKYYFLCKRFDAVTFDSFLNSFKIEEHNMDILLELKDFENIRMKTYEIKFIGSDSYVIADTLELRNHLLIPE